MVNLNGTKLFSVVSKKNGSTQHPITPNYTVKTITSCNQIKHVGQLYISFPRAVHTYLSGIVCPVIASCVLSVFPQRKKPMWLSSDICRFYLMGPHNHFVLCLHNKQTNTHSMTLGMTRLLSLSRNIYSDRRLLRTPHRKYIWTTAALNVIFAPHHTLFTNF